jgi:hypothetical protein
VESPAEERGRDRVHEALLLGFTHLAALQASRTRRRSPRRPRVPGRDCRVAAAHRIISLGGDDGDAILAAVVAG